jgi:hypothetical protein
MIKNSYIFSKTVLFGMIGVFFVGPLASSSVAQMTAALANVKQKVHAINHQPFPLPQNYRCDVLEAAYGAVSNNIGPNFIKVWRSLGAHLLLVAQSQKDRDIAQLVIDMNNNQNGMPLSCVDSNGQQISIPGGKLIMPQDLADRARSLTTDLEFSPVLQKKLSRFEQYLEARARQAKK